MSALEVQDLTVHRGSLRVVQDVTVSVASGEIVGLLGLNGAGKSSLLASIAGDLPSSAGRVVFDGRNVAGERSWDRCKRGLVLVPAGRQLFAQLTVTDNLLVGGHLLRGRNERQQQLDKVFDLFPILREKAGQAAGRLSGGQQQMLAIGRGLMAKPAILMLDEPSEGLAPVVVSQVFEAIRTLRDSDGLGILLAEQNVGVVDVIDTIVMMQAGRVTEARSASSGDAEQVADYVFGRTS